MSLPSVHAISFAGETETVFGIVYHIAPEHVAEVLDALYYREKVC